MEQNNNHIKEFFVTKDHIKLLKRMCVSWQDCEYGAPEINPKRPYGNSDVEEDIIDILGWERGPTCVHCGELASNQEEFYQDAAKIHQEMLFVLQILIDNPTDFGEGHYSRLVDGAAWKRENKVNFAKNLL